ncbi:MAG: efflux RND transporter periplasmic adaptor subunit [Deltaproteobacteria bacterium]|nr:efflux RND transporter periplasmic adaptor subunit [Deltaproteobacteria bacterium]
MTSRVPKLVLAAAALLGACSRGEVAKKPRPPPLVAVAQIAARDVPVEVRAPVDLRPLLSADVGSKTLGYLDAVMVDRGDKVKKGQLLAIVRPSDLPDQLAAARSSIAQVEAQAALAKSNYDRAKELEPKGIVSKSELDQAKSQYEASQAALSAAQAQVGAVATRLGETRIESPIDGVVAVRRLDPGALVGNQGSSNPILTVVRTDVLRVFVAVNEHDSPGLSLDKQAHVEVDALPGRSYAGKVVRISPTFDPVTRTLDAEVQIENHDGELRPGMYGQGSIVIETHRGVPVAPAEAMQISNDEHYVYVVDGDTVHRRRVTVGVDNGDWLEVTSGLKAGEQVVVAGLESLSEGAKVRVQHVDDPLMNAKAQNGLKLPAPQ